MLCGGRRAWLLVRSGLAALLASLVARRWVDFGLSDGAVLGLAWVWHGRLVAGTLSGLSWVGPVVVWLVGFFCSGVSVLLFLWALVFVLSWFWFLCFWGGAFMGWGSSARAGQLGVWGAWAGLGAGVGRPRAG